MTKFFDSINNRLVYIESHAESDFWDDHWKIHHNKLAVDRFVVNITSRYLPHQARILEGGCGLGNKVFSLGLAGYDAVGLDYAEKTVKMLNDNHPDLPIILGDVRKLPFERESFDGYWSFGVIEHFFKGYGDISEEMKRVLKKDGYLFLTVPYMSLLRRIKAKLGLYPSFDLQVQGEKDFYQFALPKQNIIDHFQKIGFRLVSTQKLDGVKGLKDEIGRLWPLQAIYDGKSLPIKIIRKCFNIILSPFSPHIGLFVFKKM